MEVVTLADVNTYLGEALEEDSQVDLIRGFVNEWVDTRCSRLLGAASYEEKHSILEPNHWVLIVKNPPIRELTWIKSGRESPSEIDSGRYVVEDADAGIIRTVSSPWITGVHQYTVGYEGGYEDAPEDLKLAVLSIIGREFANTRQKRHGLRSKSFAQGSTDLLQMGLTPMEKMVLMGYTLMRFD